MRWNDTIAADNYSVPLATQPVSEVVVKYLATVTIQTNPFLKQF